jgi:heptosyltransferase-2
MKILIVKIGAIGDVCMTLPLLARVRSEHPNAHITWVCGEQVKELIAATKQVDHVITICERELYKGSFLTRVGSLFSVWKHLAGRSFDVCLTAHPDPRYRWISFPILCKDRRFCSRLAQRINPVAGRYHAEEYVRLWTGKDHEDVSSLTFPKLSLPPSAIAGPFIVISPGGAKNVLADDFLRRWPIQSYAALMKKLAALPMQLVLTGSASDAWVRESMQDIPHIDLIGKLDLLQLISLFQSSKLLITHDSGPMHLAKLVNCPTVALFGPTMPSEKVGLKENVKVIWGGENLPCRPCYDGKTYAKCSNNLCLNRIDPDRVFREALNALSLQSDLSISRF